MDDPRGKETEHLREAVHHDLASVHETMNELSDRMNRATDVLEHVRRHPIAALAIAATAGLVIGTQITSLLGLGGIAALGARAALRATPPSRGQMIAERVVNSLSSALVSAVLVPVVSGIQRGVESARGLGSPSRADSSASATDSVPEGHSWAVDSRRGTVSHLTGRIEGRRVSTP